MSKSSYSMLIFDTNCANWRRSLRHKDRAMIKNVNWHCAMLVKICFESKNIQTDILKFLVDSFLGCTQTCAKIQGMTMSAWWLQPQTRTSASVHAKDGDPLGVECVSSSCFSSCILLAHHEIVRPFDPLTPPLFLFLFLHSIKAICKMDFDLDMVKY